ncbi:Rossmann-like and DUF2520 domain-containing protein [Ohtaekwangia koreensis]|uniref:Predicted oxidoreductase, contains short-chain dehydrogenase (SDR) and DUF2520 domains n=1 Tax=Ohtaekwangia koreensis TaxID=688867 RepID=A0A1T5LCQ3_9BACT|nr:Rossmann-like and DUF2520 domain-containing protein [Ohtaekwangia koreensis]SKC73753.1 Predicted oxidoreductase, contains short-chain dehydrogenase (SDR) and DUF2520 domains [Ohtaekwangia koreensis]
MTLVSFIGSGNVAWHLAPALDNTDFAVREVYSRNPAHASALVDKLYEAEVKATLDFSTSNSHVFIIAVSDDAVESVVQEIILPENAILVHTSGSLPLDVLRYAATPDIGVFYPLQTFSKSKKVDFKEVPLFIESENTETEKILISMAKAISKHVHKISSQERKAMHVAAVFASNFTNHMLTVSQEIMKENKLSFDWLKPLIAETVNKSLTIGPENAQTGPARRGDFETLDKHMEFLQQDESVAELYKVISQHIVDKYHS